MSEWMIRDFERREREKEEWIRSRPVCDRCGEPIQEEGYYEVEGNKICEDCWHDFSMENFWQPIEE